MSRFEELIRELCPNGVEYRKIGDICSTITDYTAAGSFADIAKNVSYISNGKGYAQLIRTTDLKSAFQKDDRFVYVNEHAFDYLWRVNLNEEALVIPNVGNCGEVYYITPDIFPTEHNVLGPNAILVKSSMASIRFLYHLFLSNKFQNKLVKIVSPTGQTKFNKTNFKEISIPIPPIEVQNEIVRILDNFTGLISELTVELTARKKQYEYYRNQLLEGTHNWRNLKIIDMLCQPISDGPHTTPTLVASGIPFISVDAVWDGKIHFENKRGYITEEFDIECSKKYKPQKHDVYMVKSGSTTGKVAYVDTDERFNIWSPLAAMRVNKDNLPRFLFYLLQTRKVQEQVKAKASHGSQPNLGMRELEQFNVKVPMLSEQKRIVKLLDRFDTLCNDITTGLPAEIEARQKQYEYYRDKLLTFKELA